MLRPLILLALVLNGPGDAAQKGVLQLEDAQVTVINEVRVPAEEAGTLAKLAVKEGDLVTQGQVLGNQDDRLARIDQQLAQVDLEIAKVQAENDVDYRFAKKSLEVAKAELKRSEESVKLYEKSISKTELDRLRLMVERSELSMEQAQRDMQVASLTSTLKGHSLASATQHLERRTLHAPRAGMIVEVMAHEGEWLNPGEPVLRIIQLDRLRVEAFVDGTLYGDELLGCSAVLTARVPPGGHEEQFAGRIVFVSPELDPVTGQTRIWAEVENTKLRLRPGMRGTLAITVPEQAAAQQDQRP